MFRVFLPLCRNGMLDGLARRKRYAASEKRRIYFVFFLPLCIYGMLGGLARRKKVHWQAKSEAYHCRKNSVCSKKCRQGSNFRAIAKMIQYPKAARQIFLKQKICLFLIRHHFIKKYKFQKKSCLKHKNSIFLKRFVLLFLRKRNGNPSGFCRKELIKNIAAMG